MGGEVIIALFKIRADGYTFIPLESHCANKPHCFIKLAGFSIKVDPYVNFKKKIYWFTQFSRDELIFPINSQISRSPNQ